MKHLLPLGLLLATLGASGAEINKCIDDQGHITLTDQPCDGSSSPGTQATRIEARPGELAPAGLARSAWANFKRPEPGKLFATDVRTLKNAQTMLAMEDRLRHRLAGR